MNDTELWHYIIAILSVDTNMVFPQYFSLVIFLITNTFYTI